MSGVSGLCKCNLDLPCQRSHHSPAPRYARIQRDRDRWLSRKVGRRREQIRVHIIECGEWDAALEL